MYTKIKDPFSDATCISFIELERTIEECGGDYKSCLDFFIREIDISEGSDTLVVFTADMPVVKALHNFLGDFINRYENEQPISIEHIP